MEFSHRAADQVRKLPGPIRLRIYEKLDEAAERPARHVARLKRVRAYRLRVGDYRVILDIDWERKVLQILAVRHRRQAYR
ncbi:MAG: type II toxin-antitoxin system RelE/ParE family toxin [Thermoplasmata archaeon]